MERGEIRGTASGPMQSSRIALRSIRATAHDALRLTALRKVSSIRDCQPGPVDLKCEITSWLRRKETSFFVGDLLGPRPFRMDALRPGKTSEKGRALAKSASVSSGLR
jgi:hypothetical protein